MSKGTASALRCSEWRPKDSSISRTRDGRFDAGVPGKTSPVGFLYCCWTLVRSCCYLLPIRHTRTNNFPTSSNAEALQAFVGCFNGIPADKKLFQTNDRWKLIAFKLACDCKVRRWSVMSNFAGQDYCFEAVPQIQPFFIFVIGELYSTKSWHLLGILSFGMYTSNGFIIYSTLHRFEWDFI